LARGAGNPAFVRAKVKRFICASLMREKTFGTTSAQFFEITVTSILLTIIATSQKILMIWVGF